ncbi:cyclophilin-like domain-containing protein [Scheffersomyces coipomensis]|uniref:cyclophilin-like domain-containing protein n=1 Tax=Scheffersomyces coipomensis TaxID=1788519 RepID=UPI00315D1DE1
MASLEPKTTAKVRINTSKGPIEVDLWAKEITKTTKQFLTNCVNHKYDGQVLTSSTDHNLLVSEGDDDDIVYDLKDEFHSRIRFNAKFMICPVKESETFKNNQSLDSFMITTAEGEISSFNNKYNLFGKIIGDSIYVINQINQNNKDVIEESTGKPLYPVKIESIDFIDKYFDDLPKEEKSKHLVEAIEPVKKKKAKISSVQMSYDDEGEDVEVIDSKKFKMKSAHELLKKQTKSVVNKEGDQSFKDKSDEVEKDSNDLEGNGYEVVQKKSEVDLKDHYKGGVNDDVHEEEEVDDEDDNGIISHQKMHKIHPKDIPRDPAVDSDYDENLDLTSDEDEDDEDEDGEDGEDDDDDDEEEDDEEDSS